MTRWLDLRGRMAMGMGLFVFGLVISLWADVALGLKLVQAAREQIGVTISYDPRYTPIQYPLGDVPLERGVCSDVVIRAFRGIGWDFQEKIHQDMKAHFHAYPKIWGLKKPDPHIDHRRVPNLMVWLKRHQWNQEVSQKGGDYLPGDVVVWQLPQNLHHIGLVSDRKTKQGVPLVIHNIGAGAKEEDVLFQFKILGHYRCPPDFPMPPSSRENGKP